MENSLKKPNLFIIGAPKCGTTFLYHYLRKHPDIFFPNFKEPHFFGSDLMRRNGAYNLNKSEYYSLFNTNKKIIGEASTLYIFSKNAAKEIHKFNPNAKIIIMLRDLVDLVHSLHAQFIFSGDEIIEDFSQALDMEHDRLNNKNIPKQTTVINKLFYTSNILELPENINSFINYFGSDNIKYVYLDEIKNDPKKLYFKILEFLNVDLNVQIPKFKIINKNKIYKSKFIRNFIKRYSIRLGKIRSKIFNKPIGIIKMIESLNKQEKNRNVIHTSLRNSLINKFSKVELELNKIIKNH